MSIYDPAYRRFLERLKAARLNVGMSQEELAERLQKHQTYVSKMEKGRRYLTVLDYLLWSKALGIDPTLPIADFATDIGPRGPRVKRVSLKD